MDQLFRNYLFDKFERCLKSAGPEFKLVQSKGPWGRADKVFEWASSPSSRLYVHLQFVKDRDYVLLNGQWSTSGKFPSEDVNYKINEWAQGRGIANAGTEENAQALASTFPDGWLRLTDFGKPVGDFEMSGKIPPLARLDAAFSTPAGVTMLHDAGISDWKNSPQAECFKSWSIVGALVALTADDAVYALEGTAKEMCAFVAARHLPFLRALARALP